MHIQISRRSFLKGAALFSSIGLAPEFLVRAASGATPAIQGFKDDRILVVLQLSGGNDGLNTIVPSSDDAYYRARPRIGLKKERLLRLTDDLSLNDKLAPFKGLYDDGKLAIIQGVGYPNPDRSHFRSMEIWHTASESDEYLGTGWIGRYFDNCCSGSARPQAGLALGKERPQAFDSEKGIGIACDNPSTFGWQEGKGEDKLANFQSINDGKSANASLDFLRHVTSDAILSAGEVREAAKAAGATGTADRMPLQTVAGLIRGGLQTRIYYLSVGGFDTHAGQLGRQDSLLERVAQGLAGFQATLERDGTADRVTTMVFSEFGRRVGENASGGTDHGTAAPMFLMGKSVKPGLHGSAPSLTDLDQGDLKYTTDFRGVYASVLENWFAIDSQTVLGQKFAPANVIA
jgi:uncharacterized protein (DUF1501 family)